MLGDVPDTWAVKTVGEIASITMGQSPPSSTVSDDGDGLPFIQGNAEFGARYPKPRQFAVDCPKVVEGGDILLSVRAPVGEVNVATERLCIGRGLAGLRPTDGDHDFLYYALGGLAPVFARLSQGSTFDAINGKDLRSIPLLVPPLDEQRRIAEVLRSVDEAIAVGQKVAEQAQALWNGLTECLIWDRLSTRPDEAQPLGNALRGSDYGVNAPLGCEPAAYAVLRMGNLQDGWIDPTDLKWGEIADAEAQALALDVGDILFNRTNSRDLVGKVALVREPTDFLYASYIVRLRVNQSVADPYYLFAVMHSRRAQAQFKSIATPGVSQSNINPTNLKKQTVPIPSLAEQREIAVQLQSAEAARRTAMHELVTLRQIKADLMSDLLSGRVRVPA